jgi:uncharacterized alpha/beta hydrolase family protein
MNNLVLPIQAPTILTAGTDLSQHFPLTKEMRRLIMVGYIGNDYQYACFNFIVELKQASLFYKLIVIPSFLNQLSLHYAVTSFRAGGMSMGTWAMACK